jgi:hypothetical protein
MSNSFINAGTPITNRTLFNSGYFDFGSNRIINLDNITLKTEWTTAPLYVLGSIVPQALNRHTQKISITGKVQAFAAEMFELALGSSAPGSPINSINPLDGQPTLLNPVGTFYDQNGKEYQYQFSSAIFKSFTANLKMEDYGTFDFELECISYALVYTV